MKASVYDKCGDPTVLRYADVPDPELGAFDVLIEVQAISIEGGDVINRQMTPSPRKLHRGICSGRRCRCIG